MGALKRGVEHRSVRVFRAACHAFALALLSVVSSAFAQAPFPTVTTQVASGSQHSCALTTTGTVWCWGRNGEGQLGDGSTTDRSAPVQVAGLTDVVAIAAFGRVDDSAPNHTCALTAAGAVKCWGSNGNGQLGTGVAGGNFTSPQDVTGLGSGVAAIAVGSQHSCALTSAGEVKCWGINGNGQVGDNTTTQRPSPTTVSGLGSGVMAIAANEQNACALMQDGEVRCWGNGRLVPVTIAGMGGPATAITVGATHYCAIVGGGAKCWGRNNIGQLGNAIADDPPPGPGAPPVDVFGLTSGVAKLSAGWAHTCAVTTAGALKCWGFNQYGHAGSGSTANPRLLPSDSFGGDVVGLASGVLDVSGGLQHTCALTVDGSVRCWGRNTDGRVGNGATLPGTTVQVPVPPSGLSSTVATSSASAGRQHTCARTEAGGVACWGRNIDGQLGNGATLPGPAVVSVPVTVSGLSGVDAVAVGGAHSCALMSGGTVKCWGANGSGQVGNNSLVSQNIPVDVHTSSGDNTPLAGVLAITAGEAHSCALMTGGGVKCWGSNARGQLGNNVDSGGDVTTPIDVQSAPGNGAALVGASAITAGEFHNCAVVGSGAKCWGYNNSGQLGNNGVPVNNGNDGISAPVDVANVAGEGGGPLPGVTAVSAGAEHSCAMVVGNEARCWGRGDLGQLGNGLAATTATPVKVREPASPFSPTPNIVAIESGAHHSCALIASGHIKCWGLNDHGQLGDGTLVNKPLTSLVRAHDPSTGVAVLSLGAQHTCTTTKTDVPTNTGITRCWGANADGQLGDSTTVERTSAAETLIGSQSLVFASPAPLKFQNAVALSATALSSLPATFDSWTPATCGVAGTTVTPTVVGGLCGLRATQTGDADFRHAPQQLYLLAIGKGDQTITFNPVGTPRTFSPGGTFTVDPLASASSGLTVNYVSTTPAVCTLAGHPTPTTTTTVTIVAEGSCIIAANQGGNSNWNAAAQALQTTVIGKASQTITFNPVGTPRTYAPGNPTFTVDPLASASSGLAVTYVSTTPAVCTLAGHPTPTTTTTVTILAAGDCIIAADQPGDANYLPAPQQTQTTAIAKASQTINFNPVGTGRTYAPGNPTFTVDPLASATSGLAVTYVSTTPAVCTLAGHPTPTTSTTVTIVAAGDCIIAANQPGDANYNPAAQQTQTTAIAKANQSITFNPVGTARTYAPSGTFTVDPLASATSGLAVTYVSTTPAVCTLAGHPTPTTATTVTIVAVGDCIIAANQPGDGNYNPAPQQTQTTAIAKANQSITFNPVGTARTFSTGGSFTVDPLASASSGLAVSYVSTTPAICTLAGHPTPTTSTTVSIVAVGDCIIAANQGGDGNYNAAAQQTQTTAIAKGSQTITWNPTPLPDRVLADSPFTVSATSQVSPVEFASTTLAVCTSTGTNGTTITLLTLGTCTLTANQSGDGNFNAAPQVTRSFEVLDGVAPDTAITSKPPLQSYSSTADFTFTSTESPEAFECKLDGGAFAACTSPQQYTSLSDGSHTFEVRAKDAANNVDPTPATYTWSVDTAAPTLAITSKPAISAGNQASYSIAGTCSEAGRTINAQIGPIAATGTCGTPGVGQYQTSAVDASALALGTVGLQVTMTDASGSSATVNDRTTKDTAGASLGLDMPDTITIGNRLAYGFSGRCVNGAGNVGYTLANGASVNASVACTAGAFVVSGLDVSTLSDGTATFTITQNAVNAGGAVLKDTVNPMASFDAAVTVNNANKAAYTLSGNCSENTVTVSVSVAGTVNVTPTCTNGAWTTGGLDLTAIADGTLALTAVHNQASGKIATAASTVAKDIAAPAAPVVTAPAGTIFTTQPTVTGTSEANASIAVTIDTLPAGTTTANGSGNWSLPLGSALAVGAHAAAATATDAAGNASAASANSSFYVAPTIVVAPGTLPGGTVAVAYSQTITATDGTAPYSFAVTAGSLPNGLTLAAGGGLTGTPTAAGTFNFTVTATDANVTNGPFTGSQAYSVVIAKGSQSITFNPVGTARTFAAGGTFTVDPLASASSGLAVSYVSTTPAVCTLAGHPTPTTSTTVTIVAAGDCIIAANQPGDANYDPAAQQTQTTAIAKANQAITFNPVGTARTFSAGGTFTVDPLASASSGLAVSYVSTTPAVCTLAGHPTPTTATTVTIVAVGDCIIAANQPGDGNYNPAPQQTQTTAIAKANQAITFNPVGTARTFSVGGTFTVDPLASASSGLAVSYVSTTPLVCTLAGHPTPTTSTTVSIVAAGDCIIAASQAGDGNYNAAAQQTQTTSIGKASQTITFGVQAAQSFSPGGTFPLNPVASASSSLAVTYVSTTPAVCTMAGHPTPTASTTVTMVAVGTCTIAADQAGNGNYNAATQVPRDIAIGVAVPGAPAVGVAAPGNGSAIVSFAPPASDGGSAITSYTVTCMPGTHTASAAASPIKVTGLANGTAHACTVKATNIAGPGADSAAANVTPSAGPFAYLADPAAGLVRVVDVATEAFIGSVAVGAGPRSVVVSPDAVNAYVANQADDTVSVLRTSDNAVLATVAVGDGPTGIAVSPDGTRAYVTNGNAGTVTVIDTATRTVVTTVTVGTSPWGAAVTADGAKVFVANSGSNNVSVIATASNTVAATIPVGTTPRGLAVRPGGGKAYAANFGSSSVSVIDTSANTVASTIPVGASPGSIAFRHDGARAYVGHDTGTLTVLDAAADSVVTAGSIGSAVSGVSVSPDNADLFIALAATGQVRLLDTATNTQGALIGGLGAPTGLSSGFIMPVVPGAPTIGAATSGAGQASIAFTAPALNGGSPIIDYTASCAPGPVTATGAASPIVVTGLTNGTSYTCSVRARNAVGQGATSGASPVTPATIPAFTSANATTFTVLAAGNFTVAATSTPAPTLAHTGGTLPSGVTFTAASGALAGTPALGTVGNHVITFTATTPAGSTPQTFTLTVAKANQAISFTNPGAQTLVSPTVNLSASSTSGLAVQFTSLTASTCSVSGSQATMLAVGTCTIRASQAGDANYNAAANVDESFSVAVGATVPGAPTIGTGTPGNGQATIAFTPPASNGGSAIIDYTVTCNPGTFSQVGSASPVTVTGLTNGTAYTCSATARNSVGSGPASATVSVTPRVLQLRLTPASLDFGGQSMGTTSPAATVTVTNETAGTITVNSVSATAQFSQSNTCTTLAPLQTCAIQVTFTPAASGAGLGSSTPVAGTLSIASTASGSPHTAPLAGSAEKSLVTHYYRSILRRAPDSGGKTFWDGEASRVATLGANVNEVWFAMAQAFYFSTEYAAFARNNTAFATDLYNTFFNRAPDAPGLSFWVGQLDSGLPREVALASFMFSTEFGNFTQAIFGNTAARAEVNAVMDFYRGLLSRLPDNSGFGFWVGRFRAAQCNATPQAAIVLEVEAISSAFALSAEYTARGRNNSQYVGDLYNAFLRRGGDLAGVNFWINQIATGAQTREQVRVQFKNSAEFQARVSAIIAQGCLGP